MFWPEVKLFDIPQVYHIEIFLHQILSPAPIFTFYKKGSPPLVGRNTPSWVNYLFDIHAIQRHGPRSHGLVRWSFPRWLHFPLVSLVSPLCFCLALCWLITCWSVSAFGTMLGLLDWGISGYGFLMFPLPLFWYRFGLWRCGVFLGGAVCY